MRLHRLVLLAAMPALLALGALAPAAGCNGTGTTPMCDFPDGANNPESGCGELVEAAADGAEPDVVEDAPAVDAPIGKADGSADASDATAPPPADSGGADAPEDVHDASEDHIEDAHHDAKG